MSDPKNTISIFADALNVAFTDEGKGRVFLLLHGGAGPSSMAGLGAALSRTARVIIPTYPGFNNEPRPEWFASIDDLVLAWLSLVEKLNLSNVVVIGNSMGGWVAAEMALRHSPRISGIILLNALGIDTGSPDRKIIDPMATAPSERMKLTFYNPQKFAITPSPAQATVMAENQRTLRVYSGESMFDASLRSRLINVLIPAMILWGESDGVVDPDYGRLFAKSIPNARFELVQEAGHMPHIEQLDKVMRLIDGFITSL